MDRLAAPWRVLDAEPAVPSPQGLGTDTTGQSAGGAARVWRWVAAGGLAVGILGAIGAALIGNGGSLVIEPALSGEPAAESGAFAPNGSGMAIAIVVEVTGAVRRPGVYRLPPGARVGDAIAAAGGFGPWIDARSLVGRLNLAARLSDGQQVVVPARGEPAALPDPAGAAVWNEASPRPGERLVDLNAATQPELESLPGIGAAIAAKILASRRESPFRAIEDLRTRRLIGQATFEKVKALVTVR